MINEIQNDQAIVRQCGEFAAAAFLVSSSEASAKEILSSLTTKKEVGEVQPEKIRYGAPDGPRKDRRDNYDGKEPLEYPGHEATARFLAFPKALREFKSIAALARHFSITRKTVHCWMKDIDVLKRAEWLSEINKITAKLVIRRASAELAEKLVEMGMGGDINALKVCMDLALREDKQKEKSRLTSASLEEVLERSEKEHIKHGEMMTATWLKEQNARLGYSYPSTSGNGDAPKEIVVEAHSEPQVAPVAESEAVNACDACGKTRCVHGRCPACEMCAACEPPEQVQATV